MTHHLEYQAKSFYGFVIFRSWLAALHLQVSSFTRYSAIYGQARCGTLTIVACFHVRTSRQGRIKTVNTRRLETFGQTNAETYTSPIQRHDGVDRCRDVLRRHSPRHPIYAPKRVSGPLGTTRRPKFFFRMMRWSGATCTITMRPVHKERPNINNVQKMPSASVHLEPVGLDGDCAGRKGRSCYG